MRAVVSPSMPMFPLQFPILSQKIFIGAMVSIAALFFAILFLYQIHAQPLGQNAAARTAAGKVYLSPQAAASAAAASASTAPAMLEAHIANNGLVLLRGARVVSISGTVINVEMAWGPAQFAWTVQTTSNTKFFAPTGEKETLADIQPGTVVTVTGMLAGSRGEPTISAQFVRE